MDAPPLRRVRFIGYLIAAFAAVCFGVAPVTPARAGASVDACFNAVADAAKSEFDQAKMAAELAGTGCAQWVEPATVDLFAAVVGIVTVLDAGGAFKGGSCKDYIQTKIAAALVSALAGSIGGNNPLSWILDSLPDANGVKAEIQQLANNIASAQSDQAANAAAEQAYTLLQEIPGIGQAISMLPCACIVADAEVNSGSDLAKAGSEGGQCAQFALQCAENPIACAQSLFESGWDAVKNLVNWVGDELKSLYCGTIGDACGYLGLDFCSCSEPSPPQWVDCVAGAALGGDVWDLSPNVKYSASSNQVCSCPATMKWQQHSDGAWTCSCPDPGQVQVAYGICQCPAGTGLLEGSCQTCPAALELQNGICTCPVQGQLINDIYGNYSCVCPTGQATAGAKCVPMCADVSKILLGDGTCCSPSQVSSCGVCCPSGQKADPGSGSCVNTFTPKPGFKPIAPSKSR